MIPVHVFNWKTFHFFLIWHLKGPYQREKQMKPPSLSYLFNLFRFFLPASKQEQPENKANKDVCVWGRIQRGWSFFPKTDIALCGRQQAPCSPAHSAGQLASCETQLAPCFPSQPLPLEKLTQRMLRFLWAMLDKTLWKPATLYWFPPKPLFDSNQGSSISSTPGGSFLHLKPAH